MVCNEEGPFSMTAHAHSFLKQLTSFLHFEKIFNLMIRECIKLLGEDQFQKVYIFLKDARFGEDFRSEESVVASLGKIVKNPRDCFLVDQLLFMEKQAEIAAMM